MGKGKTRRFAQGDPFNLNRHQQALLQTIFEAWGQNGAWPTWNYVHYRLKRLGINGAAILRTLPERLVSGVNMGYPHAQETVSLTIAGVNLCRGSAAQKDAFMRLLRLALKADQTYLPSPASKESPQLDEAALIEGGIPPEMLRPVSEILDHWVGTLSRFSRESGGTQWILTVSPEIERWDGVKNLDEYLARVATWLRGPTTRRAGLRQIFVLMPLKDVQQPVYDAIRKAVRAAGGYACRRSDEIPTPGRISFQIIEAIKNSDLIIVDLAGHNPNVMYELGYAHAADRPTILLAPKRYTSPFDIHDWRYIQYSHAELDKMADKLAAWLRQPEILAALPRASASSTTIVPS